MTDNPPDDLTLKQKMWLVEYLKTGNATRAALKAYETDDPGSASVIGSENLAKLREPVRLLMESRGLTLNKLLDVLEEGLGATKVISAIMVSGKDAKDASEATKDFIEIPDHPTRHKYLETAGKWLGVEKKEPTVAVQVNNVIGQKRDDYGF